MPEPTIPTAQPPRFAVGATVLNPSSLNPARVIGVRLLLWTETKIHLAEELAEAAEWEYELARWNQAIERWNVWGWESEARLVQAMADYPDKLAAAARVVAPLTPERTKRFAAALAAAASLGFAEPFDMPGVAEAALAAARKRLAVLESAEGFASDPVAPVDPAWPTHDENGNKPPAAQQPGPVCRECVEPTEEETIFENQVPRVA